MVQVKSYNKNISSVAFLKRRISHADINGKQYYKQVLKEIKNSNISLVQKEKLIELLNDETGWEYG
jgi:hypothetical protein